TFAFFGADAFVTLAVVTVRHHPVAAAGIGVTVSPLSWTVGAWIQARLNQRWEGRRLVRVGLSLVVVGVGGMIAGRRPPGPPSGARPARRGGGGLTLVVVVWAGRTPVLDPPVPLPGAYLSGAVAGLGMGLGVRGPR